MTRELWNMHLLGDLHPRAVAQAAILAAALAVLAGCGGAPDKQGAEQGTAKAEEAAAAQRAAADPALPRNAKHAQLLEIARNLKNSNEQFFGELPYRELMAADTTGMSPDSLAAFEYTLGLQCFRMNHPHEAEAHLARSYELVPAPTTGYMLGVAQLRIGEVDNCCNQHNAESCIAPLSGGGLHKNASGADRALVTLLKVLENCPADLWPKARWFANLAAMAVGKWPDGLPERVRIPADKFQSQVDFPRFNDIAIEKGLDGPNLAGGSIMDDFNGDGFLDIVISTANIEGQLRYYQNRGDGSFVERTEEAGLIGQLGGLNLIHADYDNDGDRDLLVLRGGWMGPPGCMPKSLLKNNGDATFVDVTEEAGLGIAKYPTQTADFADYDLDGDLDLYIGHETPKPEAKLRYPSMLFRNEGNGKFTDVAETAGVANDRFAKGVAWGDYDGDRYPDLYVSNQFMENRLYHNNRDGTFTDVAKELAVTEPTFSFPCWFFDYDNDGRLDIFVSGYGGDLSTYVRSFLRPSAKFGLNALYHNEGGTFRDVSKEAGLTLQTLGMGANFGDLDNDGWLDFFLGTGNPHFDTLDPNSVYRNDGRGGFQDVTYAGGFGNLQKGHGVSFGDVDNDGDQDIFFQQGGIFPYDEYYNSLYENPGFDAHWITLVLEGKKSNRDANGARVRVRIDENGRERDIYRWVGASGSFGGSSLQQEIGLAKASRIVEIEVYWPMSDTTQRFQNVDMDAAYRIIETEKDLQQVTRARFDLS